MNVCTPYLYDYAVSTRGLASKAVWHLFYVIVDVFFIHVIVWVHRSFSLRLSKLSLFSVILIAIQACTHLLRLLEKTLFETSYLSSFYTYTINVVNILFVFVCFLCIILGFQRRYQLDKACR